jgi:hypothetical protein
LHGRFMVDVMALSMEVLLALLMMVRGPTLVFLQSILWQVLLGLSSLVLILGLFAVVTNLLLPILALLVLILRLLALAMELGLVGMGIQALLIGAVCLVAAPETNLPVASNNRLIISRMTGPFNITGLIQFIGLFLIVTDGDRVTLTALMIPFGEKATCFMFSSLWQWEWHALGCLQWGLSSRSRSKGRCYSFPPLTHVNVIFALLMKTKTESDCGGLDALYDALPFSVHVELGVPMDMRPDKIASASHPVPLCVERCTWNKPMNPTFSQVVSEHREEDLLFLFSVASEKPVQATKGLAHWDVPS